MAVTKRIEGHIGYVTIDNPPVNAISQVERAGLLEAVAWAEKSNLDRVILSGAGRGFSAGADIREFDAAAAEPDLPDVFNAIDQSWVPWVAAITGHAVGGGAELAMACRVRIAAPSAKIGLPEVSLGLIPGAGGTARLPRLVGLAKAADIISTGEPISAADAFAAGLLYAVEEDPVDAAFMINTEELGCVVPTWELPPPAADPDILAHAKGALDAGQTAQARAIDVIEAGLSVPFDQALEIERAAFLDLKSGDHAKALRDAFFAKS